MLINEYPKLIDVTRLVGRRFEKKLPTGIDRVTLEYVRRYKQNAFAMLRIGRFWLQADKNSSKKIFDALLVSSLDIYSLVFCMLFSKSRVINSKNSQDRLMFHVEHNGLDNHSYSKSVQRKKIKPFYFLHDLVPLTHPEHCIPKAYSKHDRRLMTMINTGCGLILNSEDTRKNLIIYAEKHHLKLPPLIIAPLGVKALSNPKMKKPIHESYFVMLGTIESRKNHLLILNVWRRMVEKKRDQIPKLVLIGRRGWECEQTLDMLDRCSAMKEHVIEISDCTDEMLSTWLCHARALLFPTFCEGYGLPIGEAFSLGVPVIASNLSVFKEIAGSVPDYLDPLDGLGWFHLIEDYSKADSPKRLAQIGRMKNFKMTSWNDHFSLVDSFLEKYIFESS